MEKNNIAIIGGGAAGFFAAITAKEINPKAEITIFEKNRKVLAKVLITGGGRCNLTNTFDNITDMKQAYPRGDKLIKRLFRQFDYNDLYRWFEDNGVPLVVQDDRCVFPKSQDAATIVGCLVGKAKTIGVKIVTGARLTGLSKDADGRLQLLFHDGRTECFDKVAVTTGGSQKAEGIRYLQDIGHAIEQPVPSLFTFNIADKNFCSLMGTVVEAVVSIPSTNFRASGSLLITHWGMSGPAVLKLSSYAARYLYENDYKLPVSVNWVCETNRSIVEEKLSETVVRNPQKQLGNIRPYDLPSRLWLYILERTGLPVEKRWSELGRKGMNKLIEVLTNDIYIIAGKGTFRDEFVTCGGISLKDINYNTMESKICPDLYFAGEVLDIDAITGGFNLQAAWTTGYVAGWNMAT